MYSYSSVRTKISKSSPAAASMPHSNHSHRPRGPRTIAGRITLGMLAATLLVSPVVVLSLFYSGLMNRAIQRTVDVDIELMRTADRITVSFLTARRHEKNYTIFGDSSYLTGGREALDHVAALCRRGRRLDPTLALHFDSIVADIGIYRALLDTLAQLPPQTLSSPAQLEDWNRIRARHQLLLDLAFAAEEPAVRESLAAEAAAVASEIELPLRGGIAGRLLAARMRSVEESIIRRTDTIARIATARVHSSRSRVRQLNAWAQRNIILVLALSTIVLVWLIATTPRRILLPLKRIGNALARAEEGDLDIHVTIRSGDELETLGRQLNRVLARLREFDERKTNRILLLERRFRLLAASIAEGVLVVDRAPNIVFANAALEPLLGVRPADAVGRSLADFPNLQFLREPLENTLAGAVGRQECEIVPELPGSALCIEALRDNTGSVVGALVIVINPMPPLSGDTAEPTAAPPEQPESSTAG